MTPEEIAAIAGIAESITTTAVLLACLVTVWRDNQALKAHIIEQAVKDADAARRRREAADDTE
jgi:quinol monooxygenase YgiN